ncbi:MAG: hypothetical protein LC687_06855 [Actinobacteria bacterium]|nr:hypothetical protein [Actinomycetota bacterium]
MVSMPNYTYKVLEISQSFPDFKLDIVFDLGFGLLKRHEFDIYGVPKSTAHELFPVLKEDVAIADEIYVRSIKREGCYLADISYRIGDQWYTLAKQLTLASQRTSNAS